VRRRAEEARFDPVFFLPLSLYGRRDAVLRFFFSFGGPPLSFLLLRESEHGGSEPIPDVITQTQRERERERERHPYTHTRC